MKVAGIMTRAVVSVGPDESIMHAVRLMLQRRVSGLPVVDAHGALIGIVTEGDFLRRAETGTARRRPRWLEFILGPGRLADEYVHTHARKVGDVMSRRVRTVDEETTLKDVVQIMEQHRIKRLPVVRDSRLVGIVSRVDLVRALGSFVGEAKPVSADDASIQQRLVRELEGQSWAPVGTINVIVRDGVVHLWGTITEEGQRHGIRVAAENTRGAKAVVDHLVSVEPLSGIAIPPPADTSEQVSSTLR
jgi:CBS domain-containing protein